MNSITLLQMVVQQTWQVALLAGLVWFLTRSIGRERPHLSHMLWALVLVKCITPPIWSSPVGLFSQISNYVGIVENRQPNASDLSNSKTEARNHSLEPTVGIERNWTTKYVSADETGVPASPSVYWDSTVRLITIAWISGASLVGLFSIVRFMIFIRLICRRTCETPPEVARCVERLNQRLGLQRQVGVRVVECLIGPAVYGLWKPVILLPKSDHRRANGAAIGTAARSRDGSRSSRRLMAGHDSIDGMYGRLVSPVGLVGLASSNDRIRAML